MAETRSRRTNRSEDYPRRGDIYLAALDPALGHEIKKTRPALIIQNDISNRYSPTAIVAAITSKVNTPRYPNEALMEPSGASGLQFTSTIRLARISHRILSTKVPVNAGAAPARALINVAPLDTLFPLTSCELRCLQRRRLTQCKVDEKSGLDQVRTIDRRRLLKRLGSADPATMRQVDLAIQASLGLVQF